MSGSGLVRSGCTSETVKVRKVSGPDDILNEMLIYGGGKMVETLIDIFNLHGDKRRGSTRGVEAVICYTSF